MAVAQPLRQSLEILSEALIEELSKSSLEVIDQVLLYIVLLLF